MDKYLTIFIIIALILVILYTKTSTPFPFPIITMTTAAPAPEPEPKTASKSYEPEFTFQNNHVPIGGISMTNVITERDRAVVYDKLYPPISRPPRPFVDDYITYKDAGLFDFNTRQNNDTYKLMGYLINSNDKNEKWNIYGRQKYSGSSQGDFYATEHCDKNSCIKIELDRDMIVGKPNIDYYNLPSTMEFTSPVFKEDPYLVVQLNNASNYSPYI
jgi:hypothetical protein